MTKWCAVSAGAFMSQELLSHVFGSLQGLEKTISDIKDASTSKPQLEAVPADLREQERVVRHMRRVANRLQFEFACGDWKNIVRSLNIFYGLNSMVRPSVMAVYAALLDIANPFDSIESKAVSH